MRKTSKKSQKFCTIEKNRKEKCFQQNYIVRSFFFTDLIIKEISVFDNPKSRQFFETVEGREWVKIVDEDVRDPEVLHEVQIDGQPVCGREVAALLRKLESVLRPVDAEVHAQADGKLFVVDAQHVEYLKQTNKAKLKVRNTLYLPFDQILVSLDQGFPTCDTQTGVRWYAEAFKIQASLIELGMVV